MGYLSVLEGPCVFGQLPEEDELMWEDGSAYPEFCLDQFTLWTEVSSSQP